ncbi:MAG: hypothetical protein K5884_10440 [Ruminococcus sp.]|uniref:hypothetical protein n=1 Tax=uncultured Ruminococcus sp. TaxID=165186 RepID=UPI00263296C0|nr:hypothetical protein [uncultured Ruminococcus sp.]MCR4863010.1 hypothetical protein [Ruminococcus sp.]
MAENDTQIFRKKSLESISSPEQLNDYLKVTNIGIWVLLASVILLLAGLFAWSTVGRLETTANGVAVVENGTAQILIFDTSKGDIKSGMTVRMGDDEYTVSTVEKDDLGRSIAYAPVSESDGKYDVKIVIESIAPISFLFS